MGLPCVRPDAHGDEEGTLEAPLDGPFAALAIPSYLTIGSQLGNPDSIYLQDWRHLVRIWLGAKLLQAVQPLGQGA